jgi:hypothetical protein
LVFLILAPRIAGAVIPEGLEAFADSGGLKRSGSDLLYMNAGYVQPSFADAYYSLEGYASLATKSGNYFTYGAMATTGSQLADRDVYFGRYDLTFSGQSISLKYAHQDLRYINAGKNIVSLDYNADLKLGREAQFYLLAGLYYRFNLNSWNQPSWSPFNFNTEDRDAFIEFCFGSRIKMGQVNYLTVDVNNRDPFLPYNGDNIALDFSLNFVTGRNLTWRITESTRFSGLLAGTADIGEETLLLGFLTTF